MNLSILHDGFKGCMFSLTIDLNPWCSCEFCFTDGFSTFRRNLQKALSSKAYPTVNWILVLAVYNCHLNVAKLRRFQARTRHALDNFRQFRSIAILTHDNRCIDEILWLGHFFSSKSFIYWRILMYLENKRTFIVYKVLGLHRIAELLFMWFLHHWEYISLP